MISIAANNLTQLIKQIARQERVASDPCDVFTGHVVSTNPFKVYITSKCQVDEDFLIITKTAKEAELKKDDKVVLIRVSGGQRFLLLDKVV